ncbi:CD209 antigen-like protein A [Nannospalax galili]|uniref:CD209 antigen-like protein A n=1 Tax=Nannospalax galili TaxID=1026970 RepID=UPI00081A09F9|nr:CD209 antigen-like protein A [Nannospalax galili]
MAGEPEPQQPGSHECLTGVPWLLLLLFSLGLFSVLLLATLVQGFRNLHQERPRMIGGSPAWVRSNCGPELEKVCDMGKYKYKDAECRAGWEAMEPCVMSCRLAVLEESVSETRVPPQQIPSSLEQIQQQLIQINASLVGLYCPCPSDWELFQGSRYLFSWTLGSWQASVSACQDLGAHLVIVNSIAEQSFLNHCHIRKNELSSISLREDKREASRQWVDHTPLVCSFWKEGEPNNDVDEDCVKLREDRWNDSTCTAQNFWVCEQPAAPCSDPQGLCSSSLHGRKENEPHPSSLLLRKLALDLAVAPASLPDDAEDAVLPGV